MSVEAVGRTVAFNTSGPCFESSHWQYLHSTFVFCQLFWKDEYKEKGAQNGPLIFFAEIMHSDRLKLIPWLATSNHSALFQRSILMLHLPQVVVMLVRYVHFYMTSAVGSAVDVTKLFREQMHFIRLQMYKQFVCNNQCDQIWWFLEFLVKKFFKNSQILWWLFVIKSPLK